MTRSLTFAREIDSDSTTSSISTINGSSNNSSGSSDSSITDSPLGRVKKLGSVADRETVGLAWWPDLPFKLTALMEAVPSELGEYRVGTGLAEGVREEVDKSLVSLDEPSNADKDRRGLD